MQCAYLYHFIAPCMTIKCEEPLPPNVIEIKVECMSVQIFLRKATIILQGFLSV